jgi:hypothetical protein
MSSDGYGYGPGIGTLIGLKMGSVEAGAKQHQADLEAMRAELRNAVAGGLYDQAFAQAAAEVTAEIVGELNAEQAGQVGARRLSEPGNVDGRNEAYARKAAAIVRRLSDGHVRMTAEDIARVKASRPLK